MKRCTISLPLIVCGALLAVADEPAQTAAKAVTNPVSVANGSLPPFLKGAYEGDRGNTAFEYDKLQDGERYGLRYVSTKEEKTAPDKMWLHKVVRWIPSRDPQWGIGFARKVGFTNEPRYYTDNALGVNRCDKNRDWAFFDILRDKGRGMADGGIRYSKGPFRLDVIYMSKALAGDGVYSKENKHLTREQAYETGRAALTELGVWPSNMGTNYCQGYVSRDVTDGRRDLGGDWHFVFPWGWIDGWQAHGGDSVRYRFSISATGGLDNVEFGWRETERFGLVELKTPKEAFEDLDRGYSMPLQRGVKGVEIRFSHCAYMMSLPEMEYVYPVYIFNLVDKKWGGEPDICVPAIASRYFVDPKEQVKVRLPPVEKPRNMKKRRQPVRSEVAFPLDLRAVFMDFHYVATGMLKPTTRTNEWVLTARNDIACRLLADPVFRVAGGATNNSALLEVLNRESQTAIVFIKTWIDCDDCDPEGIGALMVGDQWLPFEVKDNCMQLDLTSLRADTLLKYDKSKPLSDLAELMRKGSLEWVREFEPAGIRPVGALPDPSVDELGTGTVQKPEQR